ncbi:MAG: adenylyltransferase/cytidyltransferase family protein [Candidatus Hydrothermarchaeales archaeon]
MKEALKAIWLLEFKYGVATENGIKKVLEVQDIVETINELLKEGLIREIENGYTLTKKGREQIVVVVCGGVFDILHPGHGFILEKAKELGDILLVIVARDSTVKKMKRIPIVPEKQRLEMVGYLKPVDIAVLGKEGDFLDIIEEIRPDVIALGPDQRHNEDDIKATLKERGLEVEIKRIEEYRECPLHSTNDMLQKIIEMKYPHPPSEGE